MKSVLFFLSMLVISCKTIKPSINLYQTNDYNGLKKVDEFFIKDSTLFLFSNGDMSGCIIDVLQLDHTLNDTSYFRINKNKYSLLAHTVQSLAAQDSIEFSVQEFCRYNNLFLDELTINEKPYKLVNNRLKILKAEVLENKRDNPVEIKFYNLGTYSSKTFISESDSLVEVFFHLNTSSAFNREIYRYEFIKVFSRTKQKSDMIIGNKIILLNKIGPGKSYFSDSFLRAMK